MKGLSLKETRDVFPHFLEEEIVPDCDETSGSDTSDERSSSDRQRRQQEKTNKYQCKEDEDVAVFMKFAEQLNVTSLLHLLQGYAHAQNLPADHCYSQLQQQQQRELQQQKQQEIKKPLPKIKKFRFAEVSGNQVRCVVQEVESLKSMKSDVWFTHTDLAKIRANTIQDVRHYRRHCPDFIESVEVVATSYNNQYDCFEMTSSDDDETTQSNNNNNNTELVDLHLKRLSTLHSFARGLETHIVTLLAEHRRDCVKAVMEEQHECKMCDDPVEIVGESLREQSLAYSEQSAKFSWYMAKCDHIEALKASLSEWKPEEPSQDASVPTKSRLQGNCVKQEAVV